MEGSALTDASPSHSVYQQGGSSLLAKGLPNPVLLNPADPILTRLAHELSRELKSDGITVTWQEGANAPVVLFAEGADCPDISTETLLENADSPFFFEAQSGPRSQWCTVDFARTGLLATRISAEGGLVTVTSMFERIGSSTRSRVIDTMARLSPVLQPFFNMWAARREALTRVRALTAAANSSDVGMIVIDRHGQVSFANHTASALIARDDGLRLHRGMLAGGHLADTLRLQASLEHVIAPKSERRRGASAPVVALRRKAGRPLMAAIVAASLDPDAPDDSAAIIYIVDPEQDFQPMLGPVCQFYGLSPVETRLACLLADGMSLTDSARLIRVSELTARSYLKNIFAKTNTRRQAELVWLILKSAVRTAPGCHPSFV